MHKEVFNKFMLWLTPSVLNKDDKHYFTEHYLKHAAMSVKYAFLIIFLMLYFEWSLHSNSNATIIGFGLTIFTIQTARFLLGKRALRSPSSFNTRLFFTVENVSAMTWVSFLFVFGWEEQEQVMVFWRCFIIYTIHVFYIDTMKYSLKPLFSIPLIICIGTIIYIYGFTLIEQPLKNQLISLSILGTVILLLFGKASYHFSHETYSLIQQNKQLIHDMQELVIRDELTQQHNRRYFNSQLQQTYDLAQRSNQQFCLAIIDIDFFKSINDNYGHPTGDAVLIELSAYIKKRLRSSDLFARYGGEEFALLLPISRLESAHKMLDEIRAEIKNKTFKINGFDIKVTISIGLAEIKEGEIAEKLLSRADKAMYQAKETGRNKVIAL